MRHLSNHKLVGAAVPAALAGSIALLLSGPAAGATEREVEPQPARMPLLGVTGAVVPQRAPASVAVPDAYTVARGDTVFGIAVRYGLRTADILAINGLSRDSIIRPGQVLRLTGSAPSTPAVVPSASAAASGTYAVAPGDTLSAIAKRHGITVQELFAANGLGWASIIYPGQTLRIGGGAAPGPAAPAAPAPPTAPPAPVAGSATHTVQAGDTLSAIARAHGITVQALFAATGLGSSSIIYPGQQIALPGAATAAPPAPAPSPAPAPTPLVQEPMPSLSNEQVGHVQLIIAIGRELGVPDRGIAIAIGAAIQESSLRNLGGGDRDSMGLFQQRPSAGWGTEDEVQDAARAARAFYGGRSDPNGANTRGLLDISGWENLTFTQAAQAVQISAYPDAYARWENAATALLVTYG